MSLPGAYDEVIGNALAAHGAWPPGRPVQPGDIMLHSGDVWQPGGNVLDFGAEVAVTLHQARSLDLTTASTKQVILKAGAETTVEALQADPGAKASVEFQFSKDIQFVLKTPVLTVRNISNLIRIARSLRANPEWDRDDFFIVHEVYEAAQFTFLGSRKARQSFKLEGSAGNVFGFLKTGVTAGLTSTGSIDLALPGAGGAVAMGLCRVKRDGSIDFAR